MSFATFISLNFNELFTLFEDKMARLSEIAAKKSKSRSKKTTREEKKKLPSKSKSPTPDIETVLH